MTPDQRNGINCHYCNTKTIIRGLKYGPVAQCPLCYDTYVSTDKKLIPSGCVANQSLRNLRREVHILVDKIVQRKMTKSNVTETEAKDALYAYVQKQMNYDFVFDSLAKLDFAETLELKMFLINL